MVKSYSESSTSVRQRIFLWTVAVLMFFGTIGSFAMIVVANENNQRQQSRVNELTAAYRVEYQKYEAEVEAQNKALSDKYFDSLDKYSSRVSAFNKGGVDKLVKEDLKVGNGEEITESSTFAAYYIGWNPDGKVFDQSIVGDSLEAPFTVSPGGVIKGWSEGTVGMKVGGVRELTIPSELAYGEAGSGDNIQPNTPLKFVIMIIPTPEKIEAPAMPDELLRYYQTGSL